MPGLGQLLGGNKMIKFAYMLPLFLLLTNCIEGDITIDPVVIDVPPLPCSDDGYLYTHFGVPVVNMDTGKQERCQTTTTNDNF